jgi:hypothetical protein
MDMIASGLEACRWGFRHYGFDEYIQRSTDNFVDALARYWLERTATIVSFEQSGRAPAFRVCYEHLVSDPEGTLSGLLDFLQVDRGSEVIRRMISDVFAADHGPGWGDQKMGLTTSIGVGSVGRGRAVPAALIHPRRRAEMNTVLRALGYGEITEDWNVSSNADRASTGTSAPADGTPGVDHLVRGLLLPRLQASPALAASAADLVLTYGPGLRQRWRVDPNLKAITRLDESAREQGAQVTMRAEVLIDLLLRGLTVDSALQAQMIRIAGCQGAEQQTIARLLAILVTE